MNNDGWDGLSPQEGASAQERSFRPEMARETESVLRRSSEESLDDYLKNINSYLKDLNTRLGAPPEMPAQEEPSAQEPEEQGIPFASDQPVTDGFAADRHYLENAGQRTDPGYREPPYGAQPYYDAPPYPEAYDGGPDTGNGSYTAPYGGEGYHPAPEWGYGEPYAYAPDGEYAEPMGPEGYAPSDWQAAVPNPELYPDLDDPDVTGGRRKKEKKRRKANRAVKTTRNGKSRFSFVTTVINLALYGGWSVLYFVCLAVRSIMFTGAQAEMASQGVQAYSVTISSPLFTALKLMTYVMPVVVLLWMRGVLTADKRGVPQLNKKLLAAAFAVDVLAGILIIFDVMAARLIFG